MNEIINIIVYTAIGILSLTGGVTCVYYIFFRKKLYIKACLIIDMNDAGDHTEYYIRKLNAGFRINKIILMPGTQAALDMCEILSRDYPNITYQLTNAENSAIMEVIKQ